MKKVFAFILIVLLTVSLMMGCGVSGDPEPASEEKRSETEKPASEQDAESGPGAESVETIELKRNLTLPEEVLEAGLNAQGNKLCYHLFAVNEGGEWKILDHAYAVPKAE